MSGTACPVAALGEEAARVTRMIDELQTAQCGLESAEGSFLRQRERHATDRLAAIESMAAFRDATSADGALFQIMLVCSLADQIMACVEEAELPGLMADIRKIETLSRAAMRGLEGMGANRDRLGGDYYASRSLDPREVERVA